MVDKFESLGWRASGTDPAQVAHVDHDDRDGIERARLTKVKMITDAYTTTIPSCMGDDFECAGHCAA